MNEHLFINFGLPQIFPMIQSLHTFEKFCLWALMIAIYVSTAICQFVNFVHLEKSLLSMKNEIDQKLRYQ